MTTEKAKASDQPIVQPPIDDRRVKVVSLDSRLLVDFLNCWRNPPAWIAMPITDELPEDCVVVSVNANWELRTIDVMVKSASFPILEPHYRPEVVPGMVCEWRQVPLLEHAKQVG